MQASAPNFRTSATKTEGPSAPSAGVSSPNLTSSASSPKLSAVNSEATVSNPAILDLAIIGGGPAALSAALYAARAGLKTQVFERGGIGGALAEISHLSNYPGFDGPGPDLAEQMRAQAAAAGAEITYGECQKLWRYADYFELIIDDAPILAKKVLVATGSTPKKLSFTPKPPVSYCALCDGDLAKGKRVAVIGGANSAVQESLYLLGLVEDLTIITHSRIKADVYLRQRLADAQENPADTQKNLADAQKSPANKSLADARKSHSLKILEDTEPTPELLNTFDYIFVFIGKRPATDFLRPLADSLLSEPPLLTPDGYVITHLSSEDETSTSRPGTTNYLAGTPADPIKTPHSTVVPGLYAAGDVRFGSLKQVVTAAADGAAAAIEITTSAGLTTLE